MNIFKRPMFYAAVICSLAAAISLFVKPLAFIIMALAAILILAAVLKKNYKYITVLAAVILFAVSLITQFAKIEQINFHNGEDIYGSFLVSDDTTEREKFNMVTLKSVKSDCIPKGVKILVFDYGKTKIKMGDIVYGKLNLSAIEDSSSYRLSDYGNNIYATARSIEIKKTGKYNQFYKTAGNIRAYVKNNTISYFGDDETNLLTALTIGDKSSISDSFLQNVRSTGISHLIVVSGLHLSIIMAVVFFAVDRIFYNKYLRCFISVSIVLLVSAVCGFTMSVIRAGVFFTVAAFAAVLERDSDLLNSLCTAITLILTATPFAIVNISFQLSVLSTLAIVWVVPFYYDAIVSKFRITSKFLKFLISTVMCSVFAMIFTLPITIKTFGFVSILMPITNILVTFPATLALVFSISALFLSAFPVIDFLSNALFFAAGLCSKFITLTVNVLTELPVTVAVLPKSAFWWSVLIIAAVIGYMYFYEFKRSGSEISANCI